MRHIGILLPETNTVVEHEIMRMIVEDSDLINAVSFHFSRIEAKSDYAKNESAFLRELHENREKARDLLNTIPIDVFGFFCTSAPTVQRAGAGDVPRIIDETPYYTPMQALAEACKKYNPQKVLLLSPYSERTALLVESDLKKAGVPICRNVFLRLSRDIDKYDLNDVRDVLVDSLHEGVDLILVSCTNLRTLDLIAYFEGNLGVPMLSSNQSLLWAMCKKINVECAKLERFGSIFKM